MFIHQSVLIMFLRHGQAPLNGFSGSDTVAPFGDTRKVGKIDGEEIDPVDPAETGQVGDGDLIADQPWPAGSGGLLVLGLLLHLQLLLHDRIESFGLGQVAIDSVRDLFRREGCEMIGLTLFNIWLGFFFWI